MSASLETGAVRAQVRTRSVVEPAKRDDKGTADESDDTFAAAKKSVIRFPPGSRVATGVPRRCKATPSEIGSGRKRCGRKTRVGGGAAVSLVGATPSGGGTRVNTTIDAYNQKRRIVFVAQPCGVGTGPTSGRRQPAGSAIVLVGRWRGVRRSPPIVRFELKTRRIVKRTRQGRRSFVTTPGRCSGRWTIGDRVLRQRAEAQDQGSPAVP